jgi:predicted Zn-dependent protease
MVSVFEMLEAQSQISGGGRVPQWQSTHPDPGNRIKATQQRLAAAGLRHQAGREEEFFRVIDGMVDGENPRQGNPKAFPDSSSFRF